MYVCACISKKKIVINDIQVKDCLTSKFRLLRGAVKT